MKLFKYIIFNIICQLVICWLLLLLNTYYNYFLVPESLTRSSLLPLIKMIIALAEGAMLLLAVYIDNRFTLNNTADEKRRANWACKTGLAQLIFTVCFILGITVN